MRKSYLLVPLVVALIFGAGFYFHRIEQREKDRLAEIDKKAKEEAERQKNEAEAAVRKEVAKKRYESLQAIRKAKEDAQAARDKRKAEAIDERVRSARERRQLEPQLDRLQKEVRDEKDDKQKALDQIEALAAERIHMQEYAKRLAEGAERLRKMHERVIKIDQDRIKAAEEAAKAAAKRS